MKTKRPWFLNPTIPSAGTACGRTAAPLSCGWICCSFCGACRRRRPVPEGVLVQPASTRWRCLRGGICRDERLLLGLCRTAMPGGRVAPVLWPFWTWACSWAAVETGPESLAEPFSSCMRLSWPCTTAEVKTVWRDCVEPNSTMHFNFKSINL